MGGSDETAGKRVASGHPLPVVAMESILHIYRHASFSLRATPLLLPQERKTVGFLTHEGSIQLVAASERVEFVAAGGALCKVLIHAGAVCRRKSSVQQRFEFNCGWATGRHSNWSTNSGMESVVAALRSPDAVG